jgi:hypothetical protein
VNARVAVLSLCWDSATAVGSSLPSARETDWTLAEVFVMSIVVLAAGVVDTTGGVVVIELAAGTAGAAAPIVNN